MLEQIIIISLITTAIHVSTWEGMILYTAADWLGTLLDIMKWSVLRKPLFECLICMGGVWTLFWYPILFGIHWQIVPVALGVIGANTIVSLIICKFHEE